MAQDTETQHDDVACDDFDYSTPEGQAALHGALDLVLEIRNEQSGPMLRKIALYERTLGLAVVPVLARRALIVLARKRSARRRDTR